MAYIPGYATRNQGTQKILACLFFILFLVVVVAAAAFTLHAELGRIHLYELLLKEGRSTSGQVTDKIERKTRKRSYFEYPYQYSVDGVIYSGILTEQSGSTSDRGRFSVHELPARAIAAGTALEVTYLVGDPQSHAPFRITAESANGPRRRILTMVIAVLFASALVVFFYWLWRRQERLGRRLFGVR